MGLAGNVGAAIAVPRETAPIAFLFGEDQARYVIAVGLGETSRILEEARKAGVTAAQIGTTGGERLRLPGTDEIALAKLRSAHEGWFPAYMSREEIPPTN
jgi:phosphoribosylformylglycinamidine synthase